MRKGSHLHFIALVSISLLISVSGFAQVNGFNVTLITYGQDNINNTGKFEQTSPGQWAETNANGSYQFTEIKRDEWSVYLFDASRDIPIQINLNRKEIYIYYDRPTRAKLYSIVSAEVKPMTGGGNDVPTTGGSGYVIYQPTMVTGNNVTFVSYGPTETNATGRFEQTGPGKWKETSAGGMVNVNFEERGRSNESLWLYNLNTLVGYQFDLRNKNIYSNYDRISKALMGKVVATDARPYTTTINNTNIENPVINTTSAAPNPFTTSDMEKIIKWISAEVADEKIKYCYRQSYTRPVGVPLSACPAGTEKRWVALLSLVQPGFLWCRSNLLAILSQRLSK